MNLAVFVVALTLFELGRGDTIGGWRDKKAPGRGLQRHTESCRADLQPVLRDYPAMAGGAR